MKAEGVEQNGPCQGSGDGGIDRGAPRVEPGDPLASETSLQLRDRRGQRAK